MAKRVLLLAATFLLGFANLYAGIITGKVMDLANSSLPGARIQIQETQKGAIANDEGIYRIRNVKAGSYTLVVSYLGYKQVEKKIEIICGWVWTFCGWVLVAI